MQAAPALENSASHVRKAALSVIARVILLQEKGSENIAEAADAIIDEYLLDISPAMAERVRQAVVAKSSGKDGESKKESSAEKKRRKKERRGRRHDKREKKRRGRDKGKMEEYAAPLSEEKLQQARPVIGAFGEKVARSLYSSQWGAREEALRHIAARVKELGSAGALDEPSMKGCMHTARALLPTCS